MGKSQIDTLADIFSGNVYMARSQMNRIIKRQIPEERIYFKIGYGNLWGCRIGPNNDSVKDSITSGFRENFNSNKYENQSFCVLKCNIELETSSFAMALKYILYTADEYAYKLYRWKKDNKVYYLYKDIVFDEDKNILFSVDYLDVQRVLNVDRNIILKDDFMSKYIYSTVIPAFRIAYSGNVILKDMRDETPSHFIRYSKNDSIKIYLNDQLHKLSKVADF